jgi:hypothetical protein
MRARRATSNRLVIKHIHVPDGRDLHHPVAAA